MGFEIVMIFLMVVFIIFVIYSIRSTMRIERFAKRKLRLGDLWQFEVDWKDTDTDEWGDLSAKVIATSFELRKKKKYMYRRTREGVESLKEMRG